MDAYFRRAPQQGALPPTTTKRARSGVCWDHVEVVRTEGKYKIVNCNYCDKKAWKTGASRLVAHLGHNSGQGAKACSGVPDDVKALFSTASASAEQHTITGLINPAFARDADAAIAVFFYYNGIAFNTANSQAYIDMIRAIVRAGSGYRAPSAWKLSGPLLEAEHARVQEGLEQIRVEGIKTGVSISSDGWTDVAGHPLINFMYMSPAGCVFLGAQDSSSEVKDADYLAKVIAEHIDDIGPDNVVLVVTDNASVCVAAGERLQDAYPKIMWVGCLAHCLDLLVKDICKLPWAAEAMELAKSIVKFIKRHHKSNHIYHTHSPTLQLLLPGDTRFASAITMFERLIKVKAALVLTVQDTAWAKFKKKLPKQGRDKAKRVEQAILGKGVEGPAMWLNGQVLINICNPMVTVLRMADGQAPCTGEVYNFVSTLQEIIEKADMGTLDPTEQRLRRSVLLQLLLSRWEFLHQPIYAAAYALNPQFWHHKDLGAVVEVMDGLKAILLQQLGVEGATAALQEWEDFRNQRGSFRGVLAAAGARSMEPYRFWNVHGGSAKVLRPLAIRLLSQSPSASPCERNWSAYEFVHSLKRNRLAPKKAEKLVYIFQNLRALGKLTLNERTDEYYAWAMHTKVEPLEGEMSGSDAELCDESSSDDEDEDDD